MIDYKQSGVNIEEGYRAVKQYKAHAKRTAIPGLLSTLGSFSGMFEVPSCYKEPIMVSGTDGVGTKLDIAFNMKKYDTVGIDCVAMSVNDILCTGATPLYFLDYIACGKLDADIAESLVKGVADGCIDSHCALLGGETAEMPGFYDEGKYDIAGFAVGIAEKSQLVTGENISVNDVLIGLSSTGVHSNGFSLVRKLVKDYNAPFLNRTIGEVLLEPTRIYVRPVKDLLKAFDGHIHAMSHITGGGFFENIPRMYVAVNDKRKKENKSELRSVINRGSWKILPIFNELVRLGADESRMYNTFNMGIGFVMAVAKDKADMIIQYFNTRSKGYTNGAQEPFFAYKIGYVEESPVPITTQDTALILKD